MYAWVVGEIEGAVRSDTLKTLHGRLSTVDVRPPSIRVAREPLTCSYMALGKIYTIFEGTSEIQRLVISRAISLGGSTSTDLPGQIGRREVWPLVCPLPLERYTNRFVSRVDAIKTRAIRERGSR